MKELQSIIADTTEPSTIGGKLFSMMAEQKNFHRLCNFGIKLIDDATGGVRVGSSTLVCAKSGGGKTSMLTHIGAHATLSGVNVLFLIYEGREADIWRDYMGYFSSMDDIDAALRAGDSKGLEKMHAEGVAEAQEQCGPVGTMSIMMATEDEKSDLTGNIYTDLSKIQPLIKTKEIGLLIVDHIDKLEENTFRSNYDAPRHGKHKKIMTRISDFAQDNDIAAIAGKQSNGWNPKKIGGSWQEQQKDTEQFHHDGLREITQDYHTADSCTMAFSINAGKKEQQYGLARVSVFKLRDGEKPPPFYINVSKSSGVFCAGCIGDGKQLLFDSISAFYLTAERMRIDDPKYFVEDFYTEMKNRGVRYDSHHPEHLRNDEAPF